MSGKLTEIAVSYSIGLTANIGDYESQVMRITKEERWDVQGMNPDEAAMLWTKRYDLLKFELDALAKADYDETSRYGFQNRED